MKTKPSLKMILVACVAALASCASPPVKSRMPVSASIRDVRSDSSLSGQVFQAVNSYRSSHHSQTLQRHAGLDRLAQEHCEYLRAHRGQLGIHGKNVSHIGFKGRTLMAQSRYNMMSVGENVAAASQPGASPTPLLVKIWSESKDHKNNMLSEWTHTGVGVVVDSDGMIFSTQIFGTLNNSQMTLRKKFNSF